MVCGAGYGGRWGGWEERRGEMMGNREGAEGAKVGGEGEMCCGGGEVRQMFGPEIVPVFFICEISGVGDLKNVFRFERERRAYLHLPFL